MLLKQLKYYASSMKNRIPIVNLDNYLSNNHKNAKRDCEEIIKAFHEYGCVFVKDPRCDYQKNNKFLDLMEEYFNKRAPLLYQGDMVDVFPETEYEVGITPENVIQIQDFSHVSNLYQGDNKSMTPFPVPTDSKLRYLWNVGQVTENIPPNRIPPDFPHFQRISNDWGIEMMNGVNTVAEMAAIGLNLPKNIFTDSLVKGAHKLAANASDLKRYPLGSAFSSFHYDLGLVTIHGQCRYPGLDVWLRTGEKCSVQVPQGLFLLQSGKQFEYLTGGYVTCGYHEVIYNQKAYDLAQKAISEGKNPWRISSTIFVNLRYDVLLQPLEQFRNEQSLKMYKPINASDFTSYEINRNRPTRQL